MPHNLESKHDSSLWFSNNPLNCLKVIGRGWFQFQFQFSRSVVSDSCSTPGFPVYHQLPESTQTHVHRVGDAIQPSHPLSSPSPSAPSPSQHQSLFQWVNSSHEVAKVLEFQLQHRSFQRTPRTDLFRMDWLDLLAVQGTLKSLLPYVILFDFYNFSTR